MKCRTRFLVALKCGVFIFNGILLLSLLGINVAMAEKKKIVYIEASMVNRWKLNDFENRTKNNKYEFYVMRKYDFDKGALLDKALENSKERPDAIIMQSCSVYFPGNKKKYKQMYKGWIEQIEKNGVKPIVATTVPPSRSQGYLQGAKEFIKHKILGKESQYDQIVDFNNWLRQLAKEKSLTLLDLEENVRISQEKRYMKEEFNEGDGIHLNKKAYNKLDNVLQQVLDKSFVDIKDKK